MSIYVLDVLLVVGALSILFTTLQKNHRIHLRRGFCALVAFALSFWLLSFQKDVVIGFISSLNLVGYLSFIPAGILTDNVKLLLGLAVVLLAAWLVYLLVLLIFKMFSKEGKRFKKDTSYAPTYNFFLSLIAGLFKTVVFAYLACLVIYTCQGMLVDFNLNNGIIYPLIEDNNLLLWAEEVKEVAEAILG
jgi:hypothetical protein